MEADIKLLEDRVRQVVQRLHTVSAERARLEGEVRDLETKLKNAQRARSNAAGDATPRSGRVPAALAESLREAIRELREV